MPKKRRAEDDVRKVIVQHAIDRPAGKGVTGAMPFVLEQLEHKPDRGPERQGREGRGGEGGESARSSGRRPLVNEEPLWGARGLPEPGNLTAGI